MYSRLEMRSDLVRKSMKWLTFSWFLAAGAAAIAQQPQQATICQIKANPAAYDRKLVQVTAFASHGSQNFTIFDPECRAWPEIWLEYGGTTTSGTVFSPGMSTSRKRAKQIDVAGISVPLTDDKTFHDFDHFVQKPPDSLVHVTLAGWFFAAGGGKSDGSGPSYGPMGCCSMLVIQQVLAFDPPNRGDLDLSPAPDQPTAGRDGCSVKIVLEGNARAQIAAQGQAEAGPRAWSFDDPARVASDALVGFLNLAPETAITLTQTRKSTARMSFEWKPGGKKETYTVVVNRPYWLSFYAKDPKKMAWVVMAVYEASCQ